MTGQRDELQNQVERGPVNTKTFFIAANSDKLVKDAASLVLKLCL